MTEDSRQQAAFELASCLAPPDARLSPGSPPSLQVVEGWVRDRAVAAGLARPDPRGETDEEDPRWLAWWLLRMAVCTYAELRAPHANPDGDLLARFRSLVEGRPDRAERHGQLHVDPASTLRRARAVRDHLASQPGPVVAVGDDDAVTVALALMGVADLHAIDVDPRVLEFLSEAGKRAGAPIRVHRRDVFAEPLPSELRHRCAAAVTDPLRSAEGALPFLVMGAAALRRGEPAWLMWADHPDWTFEHDAIVEALRGAGLTLETTAERLHAYPLGPELFPRLDDAAVSTGLDARWWRELVTRIRAFTHLYVFRR